MAAADAAVRALAPAAAVAGEGQEAAQVPWVPAAREAFHVEHGGCDAANELFRPASGAVSINQSVNQTIN